MTDQLPNEEGQDVEQEAKDMGWRPEAEWRGNKADWITAEEFVDRGKHLMPILRQNNVRLKNELLTRDQKIDTLQSQLVNAQTAIERLDKHYTEATKRAVTAAKAELTAQLKQAREEGDVDAEVAVQDKLTDIRTSEADAAKKEQEAAANKDNREASPAQLDPAFVAWNQENPWYGDTTDPDNMKRTRQFIRIAKDLREEGDKSSHSKFFGNVEARWQEEYGDSAGSSTTPNRTAKVEGSGGGRSAARAGAKSFSSLPAEARAACHDDVPALVGKGKAYATQKEWEDEYARIYHSM